MYNQDLEMRMCKDSIIMTNDGTILTVAVAHENMCECFNDFGYGVWISNTDIDYCKVGNQWVKI